MPEIKNYIFIKKFQFCDQKRAKKCLKNFKSFHRLLSILGQHSKDLVLRRDMPPYLNPIFFISKQPKNEQFFPSKSKKKKDYISQKYFRVKIVETTEAPGRNLNCMSVASAGQNRYLR